MSAKFQISRDSRALYITVVAKTLPVFKSDAIAGHMPSALMKPASRGTLLLFAYVIMPDHLHF